MARVECIPLGCVGLTPVGEQDRVCLLSKDHRPLINNNRQAGRRRGRGGQRQGNPNAGNGNRIDNRARGNASQLLEKYKTLAADAQRQGDRVNAEYYLQFADHYFRVLAESRSRFEEQNQGQRRGREDSFEDEDEGFDEEGGETAADAPRRQMRDDRPQRDDRRQRDDREAATAPAEAEVQPARRLRPRREAKPVAANEGESFDAALLPPSLGISVGNEGETPQPRRRRARPAEEAAE